MRVALLILLIAANAHAEDWPRWRGVRGDGTWQGPRLPEKWPEGGPKRVWQVEVGGGYAGISVADGRVFTMDYANNTERILCLDAKNGKLLWSHSYPVKYGDLGGYSNGPRSAPTIHDGRVYTLGAVGHLFCFEAATGKIEWSKDLVLDVKARVPMWGFSAPPIVDGDQLLVHCGAEPNGSLVSFDRLTGKERWRSLNDPTGYCVPFVIDRPTGKQIVMWTPENIRCVAAKDGKLLWSIPYEITYGVSIATPLIADDIVFITAYWKGSKAIRLGAKPTDHDLIWEDTRNLCGLMAQPLYRDGHVYSIDKDHGLTCFELKTGKKLWDDDNTMTPRGRNPHASFVWVGDRDRILSLNAKGELILARVDPKGYREESRAKVLDKDVWGHPAFAGRYLFAKSDGAERWRGSGQHHLVCVELAPE